MCVCVCVCVLNVIHIYAKIGNIWYPSRRTTVSCKSTILQMNLLKFDAMHVRSIHVSIIFNLTRFLRVCDPMRGWCENECLILLSSSVDCNACDKRDTRASRIACRFLCWLNENDGTKNLSREQITKTFMKMANAKGNICITHTVRHTTDYFLTPEEGENLHENSQIKVQCTHKAFCRSCHQQLPKIHSEFKSLRKMFFIKSIIRNK